MPDNPYALMVSEDAEADLRRLDKAVATRISKRLRWLASNAEAIGHRALTGQWSGFFRFRIGDYRAIYSIDHDTREIIAIVIGHRSDIYDE